MRGRSSPRGDRNHYHKDGQKAYEREVRVSLHPLLDRHVLKSSSVYGQFRRFLEPRPTLSAQSLYYVSYYLQVVPSDFMKPLL